MKLDALLRYVESRVGGSISIESIHSAFLSAENLQLSPNQHIHTCDYCKYMKTYGPANICRDNKHRSMALAERGRYFSGCCVNGVWELVVPQIYNGELAMIIYMGGFKKEHRTLRELENRSIPASLNMEFITKTHYNELLKYAFFIRDFVTIELDLYSYKNKNSSKKQPEEYYVDKANYFIKNFYPKNIGINDLAEKLNVNSSYLGQILHKNSGKTFRQMLVEYRIEEAKKMLHLTHGQSIANVAFHCGFNDSNYFSVVFKKQTTFTPMEYRSIG